MTPWVRPDLAQRGPAGRLPPAAGRNLLGMGTVTFEQKKAIVETWRASGLTQQEFCQNLPTPLAPRTLRAWALEVRQSGEGLEQETDNLSDEVRLLPAAASPSSSEHVAAALQAFEVRLGALEAALDEVRVAVARCHAAVDAAPACRPPTPSTSGATVEAGNNERQPAGGMPAMEPVEVPAVLGTGMEDRHLATEPVVHEPDDEQSRPATARRRRKSFFDDFSLPAPEAGEEHALDDLDTVRQATARSS